MHTHVSLFEGDENAFYEAGAQYQLSKTGRAFIAGLLHHAPEITAVTNQWVNSTRSGWPAAASSQLRLLGPQQPLGVGSRADVQAAEERVGGSNHRGLDSARTPTSRSR